MPKNLSDHQNESLRDFAREHLLKTRSVSGLAREVKVSHVVFGRFLRGEHGTNLQVATRLAELAGAEVWEALGESPSAKKQGYRLGLSPGYPLAEEDAREFYRDAVDDAIWDMVRRLMLPRPVARVTPVQIGDIAKSLQSLMF